MNQFNRHVVCLGLCHCVLGIAQSDRSSLGEGGVLSPFQPSFQSSFQYIAPAAAKKSTIPVPQRTPAQQKIVDLNAAGDYQAAGTEGMALMSSQSIDEELQLIVANSLAWTGRTKEAVPAYQGLTKGPFANEAIVGLANINRWRGRDDLALSMYQSVLANDPENTNAIEGKAWVTQALRPRTIIGVGGNSDSTQSQQRSNFVKHQWRDDSGSQIFELELDSVRNWVETPPSEASQQAITFRYKDLGLALQPSVELSVPRDAQGTVFGTVRLKLPGDVVTVGAGLVNWGKTAMTPNALQAGLTANYLGADATLSFSMGSLISRMDYFDISDSNTVTTTNVTFHSAWRPWGSHFKPFVGMETREAAVHIANYWSPAQGSGTVFAGMLADWSAADWIFYTSAQLGHPLLGEAGNSWSFSLGGKRWLSADTALNANLWSMASWRDGATYRAQSVQLNLEKLWH